MVKLFKVLLNKNQKVSTCSKTYLNLNPMGHLYSQTRQNFLFDHSKLNSDGVQVNTDQKKLRIWTLLTWCIFKVLGQIFCRKRFYRFGNAN